MKRTNPFQIPATTVSLAITDRNISIGTINVSINILPLSPLDH